uniref:Uncharacterized protein n=2 Tax=Brassica oleracea TaxID=3712 RepID=A0A0D3CZW4_BRAOL|nr:unnamed protein product [Brassica oleracea]
MLGLRLWQAVAQKAPSWPASVSDLGWSESILSETIFGLATDLLFLWRLASLFLSLLFPVCPAILRLDFPAKFSKSVKKRVISAQPPCVHLSHA